MTSSFLRRPAVLASAVTISASGLLLGGSLTPASASVSQAQNAVDKLGLQVEIAAEEYNAL